MIITISLDIKKICANLWIKKLSGKESRELAKQAVITKCRGEFQCGAKNRDFEKAVDFRALKICDNQNLHRLRAKGSDD